VAEVEMEGCREEEAEAVREDCGVRSGWYDEDDSVCDCVDVGGMSDLRSPRPTMLLVGRCFFVGVCCAVNVPRLSGCAP
jgi:hypothetical protein